MVDTNIGFPRGEVDGSTTCDNFTTRRCSRLTGLLLRAGHSQWRRGAAGCSVRGCGHLLSALGEQHLPVSLLSMTCWLACRDMHGMAASRGGVVVVLPDRQGFTCTHAAADLGMDDGWHPLAIASRL